MGSLSSDGAQRLPRSVARKPWRGLAWVEPYGRLPLVGDLCYERRITTRCAVLNAVATGTGLEHSAALRLRRLEHPGHGQGWGGSEETQLLAAFRDGRSIKELFAEHHRSRWRSGDGC